MDNLNEKVPNSLDLNEISLAWDETHHLYKEKPLYKKRFNLVMSFHPPGVAAVEDASGAYHINTNEIGRAHV